MELIFIRQGFAFKAVLSSLPRSSCSLWLLILWLAAWRFKLQLRVSSLIINPAPLLSTELPQYVCLKPSELPVAYAWCISCGRNPFSTFILSCVFLSLIVVCIAPVASPNTVQIDRMITALKRLLLGLGSLSLSLSLGFMSLQPVHQCQYRPDGWGADSLRVSHFIFFLSVSIIPSYMPLKAVENRHLAWEETFDLTEADTISAEGREPIRWWRNSNNVVGHFCKWTGLWVVTHFHNRVANKGLEGVCRAHVIQPITRPTVVQDWLQPTYRAI